VAVLNADLYKLHLYYSQEELFYEPVFVRTDRDLVVCVTVAPGSCSGTAATTSIAVANTGGDCESVANADARRITNAT
jgi:streptolysin S family bacteriocin protoxin